MGTGTIYNGTNVPINSLISSGFNYSWVNRLMPGELRRAPLSAVRL
jgi:hypothetical protein